MDLRLSKMTCVKPHHGRVSEQYLGGTVCVWGADSVYNAINPLALYS